MTLASLEAGIVILKELWGCSCEIAEVDFIGR